MPNYTTPCAHLVYVHLWQSITPAALFDQNINISTSKVLPIDLFQQSINERFSTDNWNETAFTVATNSDQILCHN